MNTYEQQAINLSRDIAERETIRLILVDILQAVQELPLEQRLDRASTILHTRLLKEMCDYKDRLNNQAKKILKELMLTTTKAND